MLADAFEDEHLIDYCQGPQRESVQEWRHRAFRNSDYFTLRPNAALDYHHIN